MPEKKNQNQNENIDLLYNKINNDSDYVVFGLSTCPFCINTINLLKKNNLNYKYYKIDDFYNLFFKTFKLLGKEDSNLDIDLLHKTVPVIFYKKKFIGGYTNLEKMMTNFH